MTLAHRATEKVPTPSRRSPAPRATSPNPYADRLDQYERLLGDPIERTRLVDACKAAGVRHPDRAVHIVRVMVSRADASTGCVSVARSQLADVTLIPEGTIGRILAVLKALGWVAVEQEPRSPGRAGGPGRATVYAFPWLVTAGESTPAGVDSEPVDNSRMSAQYCAHNPVMGAQNDRMSAQYCAPLRNSSTENPRVTPVHNSTPTRQRNGKNQASTWAGELANYAMTRLGEWKPNNADAYRRTLVTIAEDLTERWGILDPHMPALADVVLTLAKGDTANRTTWVTLDDDAARLRTIAGVGNTLALVAVGQ